jgi:O-antigen/teichoic acid export membrane protein
MEQTPALPVSLLKGGGITFLFQISGLCVSLASSVIMARCLGPSGRGTYALVILMSSLITKVGALGLNVSNVYYGAKFKERIPSIVANSVITSLVVGAGLVILGIVAFLSPMVSHYLQSSGVAYEPYVLGLAATIPLLLGLYLKAILLAQGRIISFNIVNLSHKVCQLLFLMILLVWIQGRVTGAIRAYLLAVITDSLLILYLFRQNLSLRGDWLMFKQSLAYSIKSYISDWAQFLNYRLDQILVGYLCGATALGWYVVAVDMIERLWMIPQAVSTVFFPHVSAYSVDKATQITPKLTRIMLLLLLTVGFIFAILAWPLISVLFGRKFLPSLMPFLLLLPGLVMLGFTVVISNYLHGRGYPGLGTIAVSVSLAVTLILDLTLIPIFGIAGAAMASSVSYGVAAIVLLLSFTRVSRVPWEQIIFIQRHDFNELRAFLLLPVHWMVRLHAEQKDRSQKP